MADFHTRQLLSLHLCACEFWITVPLPVLRSRQGVRTVGVVGIRVSNIPLHQLRLVHVEQSRSFHYYVRVCALALRRTLVCRERSHKFFARTLGVGADEGDDVDGLHVISLGMNTHSCAQVCT